MTEAEPLLDVDPDVLDRVERTLEAVNRNDAPLTRLQRQVLGLVCLTNLSAAEMAQQLDSTPSSVTVALSEAARAMGHQTVRVRYLLVREYWMRAGAEVTMREFRKAQARGMRWGDRRCKRCSSPVVIDRERAYCLACGWSL